MAYIGKTPTVGNFQVCDAISVVNNQAAYTMQVGSVNVSPESANHMIVSLNGVIQKPTDAFTVSGSTITFASNLVTGDVINFIQILGSVLDLGVPSDATVSTAKIVDGAVTAAKLASGVGGKVLQVVQTSKTDTFTTTSTSYTDITGMSVAITPSATSSKILVLVDLKFCIASTQGMLKILRGSTQIYLGDAGSNRPRVTQALFSPDANTHFSASSVFLDTPNTTDATTYKLQAHTTSGSHLLAVNRSQSDDDQNDRARGASSITVVEIGA